MVLEVSKARELTRRRRKRTDAGPRINHDIARVVAQLKRTRNRDDRIGLLKRLLALKEQQQAALAQPPEGARGEDRWTLTAKGREALESGEVA